MLVKEAQLDKYGKMDTQWYRINCCIGKSSALVWVLVAFVVEVPLNHIPKKQLLQAVFFDNDWPIVSFVKNMSRYADYIVVGVRMSWCQYQFEVMNSTASF